MESEKGKEMKIHENFYLNISFSARVRRHEKCDVHKRELQKMKAETQFKCLRYLVKSDDK